MSLKAAVRQLEEALPARSAASRFTVNGDTVELNLTKADGSTSRVGIHYMNARQYPRCSIAILCHDSNNQPEPELHALAERSFQSSAPIDRVVSEAGTPRP